MADSPLANNYSALNRDIIKIKNNKNGWSDNRINKHYY